MRCVHNIQTKKTDSKSCVHKMFVRADDFFKLFDDLKSSSYVANIQSTLLEIASGKIKQDLESGKIDKNTLSEYLEIYLSKVITKDKVEEMGIDSSKYLGIEKITEQVKNLKEAITIFAERKQGIEEASKDISEESRD